MCYCSVEAFKIQFTLKLQCFRSALHILKRTMLKQKSPSCETEAILQVRGGSQLTSFYKNNILKHQTALQTALC
jgi:hypothetical protein